MVKLVALALLASTVSAAGEAATMETATTVYEFAEAWMTHYYKCETGSTLAELEADPGDHDLDALDTAANAIEQKWLDRMTTAFDDVDETLGISGLMDDNVEALWKELALKSMQTALAHCGKSIDGICQDGTHENALGCQTFESMWLDWQKMETKRLDEDYYIQDTAAREAWDAAYEAAYLVTVATANHAHLTGADNRPAAGETGSFCDSYGEIMVACTGDGHCCGTAYPIWEDAEADTTGFEIVGVCADADDDAKGTVSWTDKFGQGYWVECGAMALMSTTATAIAAAYLM